MQIKVNLAEFSKLAKNYNLLPVYATMLGDRETPVSLYEKLIGEETGFLLESAEANKNFGRYSFLGFNPLLQVNAYKEQTIVNCAGKEEVIKQAPVEALRKVMSIYKAPGIKKLPPFCGGMIGYLAYEIAGTWERIRGLEIGQDEILAQTMLCQDIVIVDHLAHELHLVTWMERQQNIEGIYQAACQHLLDLQKKINSPWRSLGEGEYQKGIVQEPDEELYAQNVAKIKEYILSGDTYQTVLSHKFKRLLPAHPFLVYRKLRSLNPSPYMFYLNFGERKLVGASPEMLVRVHNKEVTTYPIAGTRPRGETVQEDNRLAAELLADQKEVAEHSMLVDLGRNDLGRVSKPGTVKVSRLKDIEYFSHVMHIVSEVQGELAEDKDSFDALQACFPAGTVSGAPKIRAMEIIAELEEERRGVYAGAVGYWDFRGNMDTCIAIRTMSLEKDTVTVQGGAGIVADSDPQTEVQEVRHKTRVLRNLLEDEGNYVYFN